MSDNIKVKPASGTSALNVATDDIGGVHYPVYKLAIGADGSATLIGDEGLPIQLDNNTIIQQERIIGLLDDTVQQLKIMNLHLQSMTDEHITKDDTE